MNKKIVNEDAFVIYGGGEQGKNAAIVLMNKGYSVSYFFDKGIEDTIWYHGIPLYKYWEMRDIDRDKNSKIVLICLANGMLHKEVVESLYKSGYRYFVFLPVELAINDRERLRMLSLYNDVILGRLKCNDELIVRDYDDYRKMDFSVEKNILCERGDYYTVFMRPELIYSVSYDLCEGDKSKILSKQQYRNINVYVHPYRSLFHYYETGYGDYEAYFSVFSTNRSETEKREELDRRWKLYTRFKDQLERGMEFFIEIAPKVIRNPLHYFNLTEGHHRAIFLVNENKAYIPVQVRKKDFDIWRNNDAYEELIRFIVEYNIQDSFAPIPHPGMMDYPYRYEGWGKTRLQDVIENIHMDFARLRILEYGESEGYFSRYFLLGGCETAKYVSKNDIIRGLAERIAKVFYLDKLKVDSTLSDTDCYDVIIHWNPEERFEYSSFRNLFRQQLFLASYCDEDQLNIVEENVIISRLSKEFSKGKTLYFYCIRRDMNDGL